MASEFRKKKEELGSAKKAARELGVCPASFYKYMAGENVPDMDVLRAATDKWGVKWKHLDPSEVLRPLKMRTAEQLVFTFLNAVEEDDIEVVEVGAGKNSSLRVTLNIRFRS